MKKFEKTYLKIFSYIAEYGIKKKPIDIRNIQKLSKEDIKEFKIAVHEGFRIGQDLIIKEIIPLFEKLKSLKSKQKEARKEKNENFEELINFKIEKINYKILLLRHFADFIAWQIFKNDYYKAKRFFSGEKNRPDLLNSNLESVLDTVKNLHDQDELNFALISDLTSFIDVGDILLAKENELVIIECKQGSVQREVFNFIDKASKKDFDISKVDYENKNEKFFKQVDRTLKQIKKGERVKEFLKNEKGKDAFSESEISLIETSNTKEYYFDYLMEVIERSKERNAAYSEVEEIVYIGVYRKNRTINSRVIFEHIVNHLYPKNITIDFKSVLRLPLKEPIFFKPYGVESIFDILFGRIRILLGINLDKLIELFNSEGISTKWLSRKETQKILDVKDRFKPFTYENQAIEITLNDKKMCLGDSFIIYLLLDHLKPSSYVKLFKDLK